MIEDDDDLIETDDENLDDENEQQARILPGSLNARRMIERRLELRRLREQLDDPDFEDSIE